MCKEDCRNIDVAEGEGSGSLYGFGRAIRPISPGFSDVLMFKVIGDEVGRIELPDLLKNFRDYVRVTKSYAKPRGTHGTSAAASFQGRPKSGRRKCLCKEVHSL